MRDAAQPHTCRPRIVLSHEHSERGRSEWSVLLDELDRMGGRRECCTQPGAEACLYALTRADTASSE